MSVHDRGNLLCGEGVGTPAGLAGPIDHRVRMNGAQAVAPHEHHPRLLAAGNLTNAQGLNHEDDAPLPTLYTAGVDDQAADGEDGSHQPTKGGQVGADVPASAGPRNAAATAPNRNKNSTMAMSQKYSGRHYDCRRSDGVTGHRVGCAPLSVREAPRESLESWQMLGSRSQPIALLERLLHGLLLSLAQAARQDMQCLYDGARLVVGRGTLRHDLHVQVATGRGFAVLRNLPEIAGL